MKVFHVSWNVPGTIFHEMLWKKNFTLYPCLNTENIFEWMYISETIENIITTKNSYW